MFIPVDRSDRSLFRWMDRSSPGRGRTGSEVIEQILPDRKVGQSTTGLVGCLLGLPNQSWLASLPAWLLGQPSCLVAWPARAGSTRCCSVACLAYQISHGWPARPLIDSRSPQWAGRQARKQDLFTCQVAWGYWYCNEGTAAVSGHMANLGRAESGCWVGAY